MHRNSLWIRIKPKIHLTQHCISVETAQMLLGHSQARTINTVILAACCRHLVMRYILPMKMEAPCLLSGWRLVIERLCSKNRSPMPRVSKPWPTERQPALWPANRSAGSSLELCRHLLEWSCPHPGPWDHSRSFELAYGLKQMDSPALCNKPLILGLVVSAPEYRYQFQDWSFHCTPSL